MKVLFIVMFSYTVMAGKHFLVETEDEVHITFIDFSMMDFQTFYSSKFPNLLFIYFIHRTTRFQRRTNILFRQRQKVQKISVVNFRDVPLIQLRAMGEHVARDRRIKLNLSTTALILKILVRFYVCIFVFPVHSFPIDHIIVCEAEL